MDAAYREQGLSEIIGFILLIAIVMVALTVYFTYTVPAIGREGEINHMTTIKNDFVQYKIMLDSLWINDAEGTLVSTSVDLGTGGTASESGLFDVALLQPLASGGLISINQSTDTLTISGTATAAPQAPNVTYHMGDVTYDSENRYWIDQSYLYQSGGVFLLQEENAILRASPPLSIVRSESDGDITTDVTLTVVQVHGDQTLSGWGPVRLDTSYNIDSLQGPETYDRLNTLVLMVTSDEASHLAAWKRAFQDSVTRYSLSSAWYELTETPTTVSLTIMDEDGSPPYAVSLTLQAVTFTTTAQTALSMIT